MYQIRNIGHEIIKILIQDPSHFRFGSRIFSISAGSSLVYCGSKHN
jgi:hypothetical protein